MKFTEGYWLVKDGYQLNYPTEVRDLRIFDDKLELFVPYKKIEHRGDTLNLGMTTITLEAPLADVVKVRLVHHDVDSATPSFAVNQESGHSKIETSNERIAFNSGNMRVEIPKNAPFEMNFFGDGQLLTRSQPRAQAEITHAEGRHFMREQLSLDPYEFVYGLGERFTPFIKNGQTVDIWNEDGGTGSEKSYKNIPFYLTNKNYGVFVNHSENVSFEVASENVSRSQFSTEGESLEYYVIYGEDMKDVLKKYTDLTGKPALPPAWSFGLWLSTSFTTDYSEKTVMKFIDEMQARKIPFDVFHFDCFWMKEFEWCGFEWDPIMFPDPAGLIKKIHERGLKVCVWINPYIGQKAKAFQECKENGYFLKRQNGQVWQWDLWQAGQGIIDFTNPKAREWYTKQLQGLIDIGVDAFKTDFGERIPTDCVYYDGSDPVKMHNYYAYLYNQVVFDYLEEQRGKNQAVLFARSASVGSQKFPVHWGGDNLSEYTSMAESLRGGLSFLLSGFGFWSHDIGGFEESATPDLYKRWTQFGLLSSHSRYHGNIEYRVPWNFGEESALVTERFSKLKNQLMPYLYKEAVLTAKTGVPMMRPLVLEFPEDYTTHGIDKEYLLGSNLLVAPIFHEDSQVLFYVPAGGTWTNYLDNQRYQGGQWYKEKYDYFHLPLLARPNSLIIEGAIATQASYDYTQGLTVHAFEIEGEVESQVYNNQGEYVGKVLVEVSEDQVTVVTENLHQVAVIFHNHQYQNTASHPLGSIFHVEKE